MAKVTLDSDYFYTVVSIDGKILYRGTNIALAAQKLDPGTTFGKSTAGQLLADQQARNRVQMLCG